MISNPQTKVRIHADHVGSLLRPHKLKEIRARFSEQGVLSRFGQETQPPELSAMENAEIEEAVRFQEEVGLPVVTDGEFRRAYWHYDFMGGLPDLIWRSGNLNQRLAHLRWLSFPSSQIYFPFPMITQ